MDKEGLVSVTIEPYPGKSNKDVLAVLYAWGAGSVTELAPGFISAKIPRSRISELARIAHVCEKPVKLPKTI